jgi:uncharacterized protein YndB with AHSA1/START domain
MSEKFASITIEELIHAPISQVWDTYNKPEHVVNWNFASDDWHCPKAENTFEIGQKFKYTMAAKDGSSTFDFEGTYTQIKNHEEVCYTLDDERNVEISFTEMADNTHIQITFEAEKINSLELQEQGWKLVLNNYKKYAESLLKSSQ